MDPEIQQLEEQLQKLRSEERKLIKEAEMIKEERRKNLLEEISQLRHSNERRKSEIKIWRESMSRWSEPIQRSVPREATPPHEINPSPPEESRTSPTKAGPSTCPMEARIPSTAKSSPTRTDKRIPTPTKRLHKDKPSISPIATVTPSHYISPEICRTPSPVRYQQSPLNPRISSSKSQSFLKESQPKTTVSPTISPQPSTSIDRETGYQKAKRIADSESDTEESITTELDPKLLLLPMVRLNRLEKVDTTAIIEERTRSIPIKDVSKQLDMRNRKQIAKVTK